MWNCITHSLDLIIVLTVVYFYPRLRIFMLLQRTDANNLVRSDKGPRTNQYGAYFWENNSGQYHSRNLPIITDRNG